MWTVLLVIDVLGDFLIEEFFNLDLIKWLREGFLLVKSENRFFKGRFGDLKSDFFYLRPLFFLSDIVKINLVLF